MSEPLKEHVETAGRDEAASSSRRRRRTPFVAIACAACLVGASGVIPGARILRGPQPTAPVPSPRIPDRLLPSPPQGFDQADLRHTGSAAPWTASGGPGAGVPKERAVVITPRTTTAGAA
jgi:hypothetical protein